MMGHFLFSSGILQAVGKLRYLLPQKRKNPHLRYRTKMLPGRYSVAVKQCKRERRFRLLGHIPHMLVDDGALFPFFSIRPETTSVRSKQIQIRRVLRSSPLLFSRTHSKAVNEKKP